MVLKINFCGYVYSSLYLKAILIEADLELKDSRLVGQVLAEPRVTFGRHCQVSFLDLTSGLQLSARHRWQVDFSSVIFIGFSDEIIGQMGSLDDKLLRSGESRA